MDDYKNSKEGRIVSQKYADILQMERPEPSVKHPRMSLGSRAKIFSPFAALRGFDDELAEEGAQTLDPVQKTLRLVLDSPHTGPGVEKEKIVILSLENIASLI